MFDFDSILHGRKHPFLSDLDSCHSLCIEFESESEFEFESGVVPLDVNFLRVRMH